VELQFITKAPWHDATDVFGYVYSMFPGFK